MKLSNEVLVSSVSVLGKLNQSELPVKVAFILAKNIKEVDKSLGSYNETRNKLLRQYAEKDEQGMPKADEMGNIIFKEGCQVNLKIEPISTHDLFKAEISISPAELEKIEFMIKD